LSQKARKLIEEAFGWGKDIGLLRRPRVRGRGKIEFAALRITSKRVLASNRMRASRNADPVNHFNPTFTRASANGFAPENRLYV